MQVGDVVSVGALQGKIIALATVGAETLVQVELTPPYTGRYPSEIVQDPAVPPTPAPGGMSQTPAAKPAPGQPAKR